MHGMRFHTFTLAAGLLVLAHAPAAATNFIAGTSEVEITADPGFSGLYKYTVQVNWDLHNGGHDGSHFYVRLGGLTETCEPNTLAFADPAGNAPGEDNGMPCDALLDGHYFCKDLPWFPHFDQIAFAKFEQQDDNCQLPAEGSATFVFYTALPPGVPGEHRYAVAVRQGFRVAIGHVDGPLPGLSAQRELGVALINEFLVKPKPGDKEFAELFSAEQDTIPLGGWYIEVNEETQLPLSGELPGGGHRTTSESQPTNTILASFETDPFGAPIQDGADVSHAYTGYGLTLSALPPLGSPDGCTSEGPVYSNGNWEYSEGFGTPANVVSVCSGPSGAAFSENQNGTVQVDLCEPATRVCIDVMPLDAEDYGFVRVSALGDSVQGEVLSVPGTPGTICFEYPAGFTRFFFGGYGDSQAAFDDLVVTFADAPGCEIFVKSGPRGLAYGTAQEEGEGILPDAGGTLVLFDNFHNVQDSVAYGNKGGAPISAPLILPPGYPRPPIFQKSGTFGTTQSEPETLSTSTQRTEDGNDTGSSANDFNVGNPTPEADNTTESVEAPALGSSIRINGAYVFGVTGNDDVEFFNPLLSDVDVTGWFISDGSVIEPFYDTGGTVLFESEAANVLPQGHPATFSFELDYEDVLYLYDQNLVRLDQMGWTQTPFFFPDQCLMRLPSGSGPADGFDFNTSGGSTGNLLYDDCNARSPGQTVVGAGSGGFVTALAPPFPNPASHDGRVSFVVGGGGEGAVSVQLGIYDVSGRRLRTLASGPMTPGAYTVDWDGRREDGSAAGAGVYFVRLRVGPAEPLTQSLVWVNR